MLFQWLVFASIAGLVVTSLVHSIGGEIYLLRPLFKHRGNRVLDHQLARMVLRFAWHVTSVTWIVLAVILYALAFDEPHLQTMILGSIGLSFTAVGIFDLVVSRGRHIGWPPLLLTGLFALAALFYG